MNAAYDLKRISSSSTEATIRCQQSCKSVNITDDVCAEHWHLTPQTSIGPLVEKSEGRNILEGRATSINNVSKDYIASVACCEKHVMGFRYFWSTGVIYCLGCLNEDRALMQTAEPHPVCRCLHVATEPHYDVIINPVLMQLLFTSCIREISTIFVTVFVYIFVYMYNICIYGFISWCAFSDGIVI